MAVVTERIYVPVVDGSEVVVLNPNDLPNNPDDLLDILVSEAAHMSTWFECAKAYLAMGKSDAFEFLFEQATLDETRVEMTRFYKEAPNYEEACFFCGKAHMLMSRSKLERDAGRKAGLLADARKLILEAQKRCSNDLLVVLTSALHHQAKGDVNAAIRELRQATTSNCTDNGKPSVAGQVALGMLLYSQAQYKDALTHFRAALRLNPQSPAEVRLGIGACAFKLGDMALARAAYERAFQLDPTCADALFGQAMVHLTSNNQQQGLANGMRLLVQAYTLDPSHVGILAQLAHFSLLSDAPEQVVVLAQAALDHAEGEALRADLTTLLARAYHATGQVDRAQQEYRKAAAADKKLAIPRLGMAQMYCLSGNVRNASSELEEALKSAPGFTDALKILGHLLPSLMVDASTSGGPGSTAVATAQARQASVVAFLKDACAKHPDDAELWELLGELTSASDPAGSLNAYAKALAAHDRKQALVQTERQAMADRNAQELTRLQASLDAERAQYQAQVLAAQQTKRKKSSAGIEDEDDLFGTDSDEEGGEGQAEALAVAQQQLADFERAGQSALSGLESQLEDPSVAVPDHHTPAKLLNNAAVIYYRSGDQAMANKLFARAMAAAEVEIRGAALKGGRASLVSAQSVTMAFNKARLAEANGDTKAAKEAYEAILAEHPTYVDCLLRLACIARATGSHHQALEHAQAAVIIGEEPTNAKSASSTAAYSDALALLSQLHMERREYDQANKHIIDLLKVAKRDCYGRIGYANVMMATAPRDRRADITKAESRFMRALDEFSLVLTSEPRNVWAANGMGAALAELGHLDAARSIFQEVYSAVAAAKGFLQVPDVLINLANVHLAKQEYNDAIHLYKVALKELPHSHHAQVLLYLARAYYDSNQLPKARSTLAAATHLAPTDHKLRFNFALTLQEFAVRTFKKPRQVSDPTKYKEFLRAQSSVNQAHRYFQHLLLLARDRTGLDEARLKAHMSFCEDTMKKAETLVNAAQHEDYALDLKRQEQQRRKEEAELARKQHDTLKEEEVRRLAADRQAKAEEARRKLENAKEEWRRQRALLGDVDMAEAPSSTAAAGGRKRSRGEKGKKKGKGARHAAPDVADEVMDELFGEDPDEPDYEPGAGSGAADDTEYEAAMRDAGLQSEGDDADVAVSDALADEAPATSGRISKRQRLRARTDSGAPGAEAEGLEDNGLQDDEVAEAAAAPSSQPGDVLEDADEPDAVPGAARKRSRRAALDDDDDEDDATVVAATQEGAAAPEEEEGDKDYGDLFGDDD